MILLGSSDRHLDTVQWHHADVAGQIAGASVFTVLCYDTVHMQIVSSPITKDILSEMAKKMFGSLVKGVVDVEQKIIEIVKSYIKL